MDRFLGGIKLSAGTLEVGRDKLERTWEETEQEKQHRGSTGRQMQPIFFSFF